MTWLKKESILEQQQPSFVYLYNHFRYFRGGDHTSSIIEVVIQHYTLIYDKGCHFEQCLTTVWRLTALMLVFFFLLF